MKIKMNCLLAGVVIIMAVASWLYPTTLKAASLSYHDQYVHTQEVNTAATNPLNFYWVQMYFPDSAMRGTYSNGVFEYDDYIGQVNSFKIILTGHGDDTNYTIDFYLDFDNSHSTNSGMIAGYNVNNQPFTLTLDIKNNDLLYNGTDVGNLSNVNLNSFVGYDTFWVGYACHFYHDRTDLDVCVNGGEVPEPASMILLGSGLLGLAGLRKKFKK
jgi:hypothetical protein